LKNENRRNQFLYPVRNSDTAKPITFKRDILKFSIFLTGLIIVIMLNNLLDKKPVKSIIVIKNVLEIVEHALPENFSGQVALYFQDGCLQNVRQQSLIDKKTLIKSKP